MCVPLYPHTKPTQLVSSVRDSEELQGVISLAGRFNGLIVGGWNALGLSPDGLAGAAFDGEVYAVEGKRHRQK
jgi:hypothetical protein